MNLYPVEIYTDGSYNPKAAIGAWVSILLINGKKIVIKGIQENSTHNRMELFAVLKGVKFLHENSMQSHSVVIYTDSQYVQRLKDRGEKIKQQRFLTNKGVLMRNADLVEQLIGLIDENDIRFVKVKAHQKVGDQINMNREADMLVRKILRNFINDRTAL